MKMQWDLGIFISRMRTERFQTDKQYWADGALIQSAWDIEKLVALAMNFPH